MNRLGLARVCAAVLLACTIVGATGEHGLASPRLQEIVKLDQLYQQQLRNQTLAEGRPPLQTVTSSGVFHNSVAELMFWHSVAAYCVDGPRLDDWTCPPCQRFGDFMPTTIMDDTANQGYVGYFTEALPDSPIEDAFNAISPKGPFVVVSFRGTISNMEDFIEDLSLSKFAPFSTLYPDVLVHEGFWGAYNSLRESMLDGIDQALEASGASTILFAGHSLGAAMSQLAALDLKLHTYPEFNYGVYTQGCPRVGNSAFSELYTQMINVSFREVHAHDIVPHLPPQMLNFAHTPLEIWWNGDSTAYTTCNSTMDGEDPNCSNSVNVLQTSIYDHMHYHGVAIAGACDMFKAQAKAEAMLHGQTVAEGFTPPRPTQRKRSPSILTED